MPDTIRTFLRWWGNELKELVPRAALATSPRPVRRLVLTIEGSRNRLLFEKGAQSEVLAEIDDWSEAAILELARIAKRNDGLPVGLRLRSQDCFSRLVELPAQAEGDFRRILELDMERSTPFRPGDVLTAYHTAADLAAPRAKRLLRHLVIKRKTIEPALDILRAAGIEPAFADCWDPSGTSSVPVDFLAATRQSQDRATPRLIPLAGLSVVLAISAVAIVMIRYQSVLDTLEARTAAARSEATTVRLAVAASQTISAQIEELDRLVHVRLPLGRIVEELTTIIPDSAWVSDLRVDGDMIEFTGFAASAASLVPLLEKSSMFTEASLTSPVVLDGAEDKERFSMRLRLRQGTAFPSAETETVPPSGASQ